MYNGSISYTTNLELFKNSGCYGFFPVALLESKAEAKELGIDHEISVASILLPSFDAMSAQLDGNFENFLILYRGQLAQRECDEFITILLYAAIIADRKILIYVNKDEINMYPLILFEYISMIYGYFVGYEQNLGRFDQRFITVLACKFFEFDIINGYDFISMYQPNVDIPINIVNKLMFELKPIIINPTPESCHEYFMNIIRSAHGVYRPLYTKLKR